MFLHESKLDCGKVKIMLEKEEQIYTKLLFVFLKPDGTQRSMKDEQITMTLNSTSIYLIRWKTRNNKTLAYKD